MAILVFTDLDGSLMEHESYSIEPALSILDILKDRKIPIILNSSKTAKEIEAVQKLLGIKTDYVCENGAALFDCEGAMKAEFGQSRDHWLTALHSLREKENYNFKGFTDWSEAEIATLTGLNIDQAALSKLRMYSEPILWKDSVGARQKFTRQLTDLGLTLLEGGRFLSIQSHYDKGDAIRWMLQQLNPKEGTITIALGDSPNDEAMLNRADIAVVIRSEKSEKLKAPNAKRMLKTTRPGPAGWSDAMTEILKLYDTGKLI